MTATIEGEHVNMRVALTNVYFRCTRCQRVKHASKFGLRKMTGTDVVRNQAQCTTCRGNKKAP